MTASPAPSTSASRAGGAETTSAKEPNFSIRTFCERLHVAPRQRAEEHELQEFIIGERAGAAFAEARAQTIAMAVIMRRFFKALALLAAPWRLPQAR